MFTSSGKKNKEIPSISELVLLCNPGSHLSAPFSFLQQSLAKNENSQDFTAVSSLLNHKSQEVHGRIKERSINKGNWKASEDQKLREAVSLAKQPFSWEDVSKYVSGRTAKQCRERWMFRISPNLNKTPFQRWEDELIVIERQRIGNHWTTIASKLPGRTSCAVKNRWYTVLKHRVDFSTEKKETTNPVFNSYAYHSGYVMGKIPDSGFI